MSFSWKTSAIMRLERQSIVYYSQVENMVTVGLWEMEIQSKQNVGNDKKGKKIRTYMVDFLE